MMRTLTHKINKTETVSFVEQKGDDWADTIIKNTPMALERIRAEMKRVGKDLRTLVLVAGSEPATSELMGPDSTALASMPSYDGPEMLNTMERTLIEGVLTVARLRAEVCGKSEYVISSTNPETQERLNGIYSMLEGDLILAKVKKAS
jgi:hypothetical protein